MSARAALSALLLAIVATLSPGSASSPGVGCPAAWAGAWSLDRGEYYSELQTGQLTTQTNYNSDGDRIDFVGGPWKLQQKTMSWRTQLGWRKRLNLVLGFEGRTVVGFEGPPLSQPAQSGLSQFELGAIYRISNGDRAATLQLDWLAPAGYDRELTRSLGDGRQELSAGLNLGTTLGKHGFFELGGAGSYRFHSLSSPDSAANQDPRMTTNVYGDVSADAGFWLGSSVLLGGRYRGRFLLSTTGEGGPGNTHTFGPIVLTGDEQLDDTVQLAGPVLLYRMTPHLDVMAGSYSTAAGKNTLHFDRFYIGMAFKQNKLKRTQGFMGGTAP